MKLYKIMLGGILIILVILVVSGCRSATTAEIATPTPIPTPIVPTKPTYQVQRGEITKVLQFNGRIAPIAEESVFFRTSGRIRNVYVEKEEKVSTGKILADLEYLDNLERQYESDKLSLRRAEINVENAQLHFELFQLSSYSPELEAALAQQAFAEAEKALADAERAYLTTQTTANQADIDAAYAQVILSEQALTKARETFEPYANKPEDNLIRAQLQSRLSAAQRSYDIAVRNYNGLSGTSNPYEQAVAAARFETAKAQLNYAKQKLDRVLTGEGIDQELALKENDIKLAQIALEEAKLGIQDLEQSIMDARLTAPIDGNVFSLGVTAGKAVDAYAIYAVIADLTQLEISADLTAEDTLELEEGMLITATLANRPGDKYTGSIRKLPYFGTTSTSGEDVDRTTRITLDINPIELGLEVGDLLRITVVLEQKDSVLWIPPQAIRTFEGREFVVIQDGDIQARVDVKIGIEAEDRVEILEGLEEGQIVIGP